MVLHHTQGWYMHKGSKLINFQFIFIFFSFDQLEGIMWAVCSEVLENARQDLPREYCAKTAGHL